MKQQWTWIVAAALSACGDAGSSVPTGSDAGSDAESCAIAAGTFSITGGGTAVTCPTPGTLERFEGTITLAADPAAPGRLTLASSETLNVLDLDPTSVTVTGCSLRLSVSRGAAPRTSTTVYDLVFRGTSFTGTAGATIADGTAGTSCSITTPVSGARR